MYIHVYNVHNVSFQRGKKKRAKGFKESIFFGCCAVVCRTGPTSSSTIFIILSIGYIPNIYIYMNSVNGNADICDSGGMLKTTSFLLRCVQNCLFIITTVYIIIWVSGEHFGYVLQPRYAPRVHDRRSQTSREYFTAGREPFDRRSVFRKRFRFPFYMMP